MTPLRTSFRTELMAIHKTLRLITTKYPNEQAQIFTNCLNCLYVRNTQLKHPTLYNNHTHKSILTSMVEMLKRRIQLTTLNKIKAYIYIKRNKQSDKLAKEGAEKE